METTKKIIFTNGCFDILHIGHISLLEHAKSLGDYLIVGINSDDSVRKLKGPNRPINKEDNRKKVLESIKYVDQVVIFNEETPYNLIKKIMPYIIVKGGDYNKENVVGKEFAEIVIFEYINEYSTTNIVKKLEEKL
jgi:D-beta-D-heptose 7-phosphate kinase/D-beta-D-heptose 1-phosphate adenosyltransferase